MLYVTLVVGFVLVAILFIGVCVYIQSSRRWFDELNRSTRRDDRSVAGPSASEPAHRTGGLPDEGSGGGPPRA